MKILIDLWKFIFTFYGFVCFIAGLLLVFPFVIVASFYGKIKGGNFIYKICQYWADAVVFLCGIFHRNIYETPHNSHQPYVFVFNHTSYMDIPVLMKTIRKQHFRILGKAEMTLIPLFGFIYRQAVVLVDRSSAEKRAKSLLQLKSIIKKNISVVIAPEGTFNLSDNPLKEFYDGAFKVAIETQTPIKPILFLDNRERLNPESIFSLTPGRTRAVYLDEVSVEGLTTNDVKMLKEKVYKIMEQKLIHYNASWIKQSTVQ